MANSKDANAAKRRRRKRTYRKDELIDKTETTFEEEGKKSPKPKKNPSRKSSSEKVTSPPTSRFNMVKDPFLEGDVTEKDLVQEDEFYTSREEKNFNEEEEEYFAKMEEVYGSRLRKPEEVVTTPEVEEEDFLDSHEEHEESYLEKMEKIYGSRKMERTMEIPPITEPETVPETVPETEPETVPETIPEEEIEAEETTPEVEPEVEEVEEDMSKKDEEEVKEKEDEIETFDTDIMSKIGEDLEDEIKAYQYGTPLPKKDEVSSHHHHKKSIPLMVAAIIMSVCAIIYFIISIIHSASILGIIGSAIITVFSIFYMSVCLSTRRKNVLPLIVSCGLLVLFFALSLFSPSSSTTKIASNKVQNFSGKTLTDVVKWANKNNIKITQQYEFSDLVPEYQIISQSVVAGTSVKDIDEIIVSVSEGPNPYKEIIVPSMLTWDSERVINYVMSNYLSNVIIEFVESDQLKDTVIEQSRSGNLKRNDELKLVFSYGEEGSESDVTLGDMKNLTQFEIEFYMKQHRLNYEILYDFSDSIQKGHGMKQSVAAGTVVRVQGDKIQVTISKGPKIEIPELKDMSVDEITEWAIKNKLKLEFVDKYDDSIKSGKVISADKQKGDVVEQGTVLKITLSLGGLKMPKFKNVDAFYAWADKYGIKYETRHAFSETVEAGEVIEYSYKTGQIIKNDEAITVTISDGKKVTVPNLKGLSKSEAIKKLKAVGLNYNFVYKNNTADKDTVLAQSVKAGSEVSGKMTVTVTLSNGEKETEKEPEKPKPSPSTSPSPSPSPTQTCNACNVTRLTKVWSEVGEDKMNYQNIANALIAEIESQCPGIDVQVRGDTSSGEPAGTFISGFSGGDTDENGNPLTSCSTVHIYLAK